jgi:transposase
MCHCDVSESIIKGRASLLEVSIIGIDLAKRVFQLHGACANGAVIFRNKLTRGHLLAFMSQQPECTVAMEACATAHCWGREVEKLGHTVRLIAPKGAIHVRRLADAVSDEVVHLPEGVRGLAKVYLAQIEGLNVQVTALDRQMKGAAKEAEAARRAQTMPGVGPITALAIETFAPDLNCFRRGRDFAAWLGLVPKQNSTGGKPRLGKTSKMLASPAG